MFAKKFSLHRREFSKIKREGVLYQSVNFGVIVRKRENIGNPRFGVVISNKISKLAVHRNRIRRSFRDTLRRNWKKVDDGIDLVFLVKPGIEKLPVSEIMRDIENFLNEKKYVQKNSSKS
jgi:ribonuclease P protein component